MGVISTLILSPLLQAGGLVLSASTTGGEASSSSTTDQPVDSRVVTQELTITTYKVTIPALTRVEEIHRIEADSPEAAREIACYREPDSTVEDPDYYEVLRAEATVEISRWRRRSAQIQITTQDVEEPEE